MTNLHDSFDEMTVEELYERLKPIARNIMCGQRPSHTFGEATVLVNEVFLRMQRYYPELATSPAARRSVAKQAATVMRRILIDHWKAHHRQKRTGDRQRVELTLVDGGGRTTRSPVDIAALDDLMVVLSEHDPLAAQVVDMRFFCGMSVAEVVATLESSDAEIEAAWKRAKSWLAERLGNANQQ